jgi:hypothetical protein
MNNVGSCKGKWRRPACDPKAGYREGWMTGANVRNRFIMRASSTNSGDFHLRVAHLYSLFGRRKEIYYTDTKDCDG